MSALKRFEERWRTGKGGSGVSQEHLFECHKALKQHLEASGEHVDLPQLYCILLGDQGVGKTTFMTRLTQQVCFPLRMEQDHDNRNPNSMKRAVKTPILCEVKSGQENVASLTCGSTRKLDRVPISALANELHKDQQPEDAAASNSQANQIAEVSIQTTQPTFGLKVLDTVGLPRGAGENLGEAADLAEKIINAQRAAIANELLSSQTRGRKKSKPVGVLLHRIDVPIEEATWPYSLVENGLARCTTTGQLVVVLTRVDQLPIAQLVKSVLIPDPDNVPALKSGPLPVSPYEIVAALRQYFLDTAGLPPQTQVFFVGGFGGDSQQLLYEAGGYQGGGYQRTTTNSSSNNGARGPGAAAGAGGPAADQPDQEDRQSILFDSFLNHRSWGEAQADERMRRLLSVAERARWEESGYIQLRENTEPERAQLDGMLGMDAVVAYLQRGQLEEPRKVAAACLATVEKKLVAASQSRRTTERDFRAQEKHKLTADVQNLIKDSCERFFSLSVDGGLNPQDRAFDFFEKMEPSLGFSLSEERRICEVLTDNLFPNFPENGNYESPQMLNQKQLQEGNDQEHDMFAEPTSAILTLKPSNAMSNILEGRQGHGSGAAGQDTTLALKGVDSTDPSDKSEPPHLSGRALVVAQKQHLFTQLREICGTDNESAVNGRNYMLDVLSMRSLRDYSLMLALYPKQTVDTRLLLKRAIKGPTSRSEGGNDIEHALAQQTYRDFAAVFYGDRDQGGANLYAATRLALNIYVQMDAAVKTVCFDAAPQNVVRTSRMCELLARQQHDGNLSAGDFAVLEERGNSVGRGGNLLSGGCGGSGSGHGPELIGNRASNGRDAAAVLRSCNREVSRALPLDLQPLRTANDGQARTERGKQYYLRRVLQEREEMRDFYGDADDFLVQQEDQDDEPCCTTGHGLDGLGGGGLNKTGDNVSASADNHEGGASSCTGNDLPTPWADVRAVLHYFFFYRPREEVRARLDEVTRGVGKTLTPQGSLLLQHVGTFLYQNPTYMQEWSEHYPRSSYSQLFADIGISEHQDRDAADAGAEGSGDALEDEQARKAADREARREARRQRERERIAQEAEANSSGGGRNSIVSARGSRSKSSRSRRHSTIAENESDIFDAESTSLDSSGRGVDSEATTVASRPSSRRERGRSVDGLGEDGESTIDEKRSSRSKSAGATSSRRYSTYPDVLCPNYYTWYNQYERNRPFSKGELARHVAAEKARQLVTPRDAAQVIARALTANVSPFHVTRPDNLAMPNTAIVEEQPFSERSMSFVYQRNLSEGMVQSVNAALWLAAEALAPFKSPDAGKTLEKMCQEGLMSLYLGYRKPLPAAERPHELLFLSLDVVIPVLYRFRGDLFAIYANDPTATAEHFSWLNLSPDHEGEYDCADYQDDLEQDHVGAEQGRADHSGGAAPRARTSFSWLERKVFLKSPLADAVLSKFERAHTDEQRLRIVDNIETWNEYFNQGNREALLVDMLQLLSQHRYEHVNSAEKLEERMRLARSEEFFWKNVKDRLQEYSTYL
ncbi:unnamed protein product [Amoebophrya sp. A25]|nr:unnamed protein product [Amoebophrya sp. A25]|eukprot:GSA25T00000565001.1